MCKTTDDKGKKSHRLVSFDSFEVSEGALTATTAPSSVSKSGSTNDGLSVRSSEVDMRPAAGNLQSPLKPYKATASM
jgi:hypothetical protein